MKPIYQLLEQKESEENWTKFEVSIQKFQQITLGSHQLPIFIPSVRKLNLLPCVCDSDVAVNRANSIMQDNVEFGIDTGKSTWRSVFSIS